MSDREAGTKGEAGAESSRLAGMALTASAKAREKRFTSASPVVTDPVATRNAPSRRGESARTYSPMSSAPKPSVLDRPPITCSLILAPVVLDVSEQG
jgi:hypothetical protein